MLGADQLHQENPESLAIIEWHNGDEFATDWSNARINFYGVTGFPTAEFDGILEVVGGYQPSSYEYYVPPFTERMGTPSNFNIEIDIEAMDGDYMVTSTFEMLEGNSTENLSAFVVLTETDCPAIGAENQNFVARMVYPDENGTPMDFSSQTIHTLNTTVTLEDEYVFDNCEIVVFIQNMDTKEIYQGYSMMMSDMYVGVDEVAAPQEVTVYPNPASDVVNIKSALQIKHLAVFNHSGQLVYNADAGSTTYNLSVGTFESGLYLFRVTTAEGTTTKRIVIK